MPKNPQNKRFDKQAFVYDAETDCYYCPAGKPLPRAGTAKVKPSGETVELTVDICPHYSRRLHFGETPFAVLKAALDLRRFPLRGQQKTKGATHLSTSIGQGRQVRQVGQATVVSNFVPE